MGIVTIIHKDSICDVAVIHGFKRGLSQIVAIVSNNAEWDESKIREDLSQIIPGYMVPNTFYLLKELPKNSNGKIDRRKLAELYF